MVVAVRGASDPIISVGDQYQYEPLIAEDAVRVLNLEPASDFQSPLCGFITQHQPAIEFLDPKGCRYSAVSYTWGDSTTSHKLFLRANSQWALLPITRNADVLIRYLRATHKRKTLWIDGICLNQKDEGEKAEQIRVMDQIFAYAKKVHIWLGDEELEAAQRAFYLMRRIEFEESRTLNPETDEFLCLERLFNRPWFTRRWIIQETFFAHNAVFHCGYHTLSLSCVMAVLARAAVQGWYDLPGWGLRMLKSTIGVGQMQSPRQNLMSLLWDLNEAECTDKRDRIAALYSLSDINERPPLRYDVGDWEDLYKDVASFFGKNNTATAYTLLLHLCSFGSISWSTAKEVPSWVPDWSAKRQEPIPFRYKEIFPRIALRKAKVRTSSSTLSVSFGLRQRLSELYSPSLRSERKRWEHKLKQAWTERGPDLGEPRTSLNCEMSQNKLRLSYSLLAFVESCGIVGEVVYPSRSEDFWEEVARLARLRKNTPNKVKFHRMEVDSLKSLLVSILAGRESSPDFAMSDLEKSVDRLCADLYSVRDRGSTFQALTDDKKVLIRRFRSVVNNFAILKVQATLGHYWAIGPPNSVKGDWLIPIIPPKQRVRHSHVPRISLFMSLRPVGGAGQENGWCPSVASDPESRLRRLVQFRMPDVDSVHITGKFVGSGGSCRHYSLSNWLSERRWWRMQLRASEAAEKRGLPGPVIFDIL